MIKIQRLIGGVACLALAGLGLAIMGWLMSGGSFYVVSSPSMSPVEPVGALLLVRPVPSTVKVGSIMIFEPPSGGEMLAHQVVASRDGEYRTKGRLNASDDPWTLTKANLHGEVVEIIPALGRAVQATPIWLACLLLYALVAMIIPKLRFWLGPGLLAVAVAAPLALFHPLVSAQLITTITKHGVAHIYLVSTGVLPAFVVGAQRVLVEAGHTVVLTVPVTAGQQQLTLPMSAALSPWQWGILAAICASPLLWSIRMVRRLEAGEPSQD